MSDALRDGQQELDRDACGSCSQFQLLQLERARKKPSVTFRKGDPKTGGWGTRQTSKYTFAQALRRPSPSVLPGAEPDGTQRSLRLCIADSAERSPPPAKAGGGGGARTLEASSLDVGVAGVLTGWGMGVAEKEGVEPE